MAQGPDKKRKITDQQEMFCQRYTTHWNATRAAKEANYTEKNAHVLGHQLLKNPLVKARVLELTEGALADIGITRERVLLEYSRIAFLDPAEAYDEDGNLLYIKSMSEDVRRTIHKIKSFEEYEGFGKDRVAVGMVREVEFSPKKAALDSIAKVLGMTPDKIEHSGPNGKPIELKSLYDLTDEELEARLQALVGKGEPGNVN